MRAVEVVERLLVRARSHGASDLHLDPCEEGVVVTLRRDGVLSSVETLPHALGPHVVGRFKALADLLAYRTDVPQEGRIPADRSGIEMEVRVGTYPTLLGERVAARLDAPEGRPQNLAALGLPEAARRELCAALAQPEGVLLLTGPSGSGKTTTLYSCLHWLVAQEPRRSLVTIEDPVERRVRGVTQTEVNPPAGLTFARALRSLLRQDPDVILVGEIRDRETAAIALEAGLTGHLVLSTLAAEWITMERALRQAILRRADGEELAEAARAAGGRTLRDEAQALVMGEATTQEEVDRVLGHD
ncbi:MAG: GspE/PulE family protein [Planctomycetota bacterium]|jgi:type II secretory ATPase GspE/PulE/Tfp pilus assembly ATPase PilB-like protein